jgi:prepilin-type N-terminal cleavage/methylation domain-containing protein
MRNSKTVESKKMNNSGKLNTGKVKKSRTGFTLVELLVVIAIIGILASMLMPAINSARESARSAQCGSNSRNIALAANSYSQQNKDQLPMIGTGTGSGFVELLPYLEMSNLYDTMKNFQGEDDGSGGTTTYSAPKKLPIFVCPSSIDPDIAGQSNYAMNGGKNLEEFTTETARGRGAFHPSKKTGVSLMARDGLMNTIFYSEKQANGAVCNSDTNGGAFHGGKTPNDYTGMPPDGGSASDPNDPFNSALDPHAHSNHPGGVNAAFGDAHVGFYNNNVNLTHWQALTTANGGEAEFAGSE